MIKKSIIDTNPFTAGTEVWDKNYKKYIIERIIDDKLFNLINTNGELLVNQKQKNYYNT